MGTFNTPLEWIGRIVNTGQFPTELDTGATVQPVLDVLQGGWGVAQAKVFTLTWATDVAVARPVFGCSQAGAGTVEGNQDGLQRLLLAMAFTSLSGAADVIVGKALPGAPSSVGVLLDSFTIGASTTRLWSAMFPGMPYVIFEPGTGLFVRNTASAGGSYTVTVSYIEVPAGTKMI